MAEETSALPPTFRHHSTMTSSTLDEQYVRFTYYMQYLKVQMAEGGMEDLGLHLHTITLGFTIMSTTLRLSLTKP